MNRPAPWLSRRGLARMLSGGAAACLTASGSRAADLTARQIVQALVAASPENPADFSRRDLTFLDLSGLDFKQARLAHADLYGVDLSDSDLSGADLSFVRLDRATLIKTRFPGARLRGATLRLATTFSALDPDPAEAPIFTGADLSDTRIVARLTRGDFRGADLSRAVLSQVDAARTIAAVPSTDLNFCDFTGARLFRADLAKVKLAFARLVGADLTGAVLRQADLSRADLTGADLTGADLTGADLDEAVVRDIRGLDAIVGWAEVKHRDRIVR